MLLAIRGSSRPWLLVGEIASALMVAPHSALGLVERAAAAGLVRKEIDPNDHRKVRVHLTPRADLLIRDLTLAHRSELRRLWRQIPPPQ
jgi:DNA-binding MarR family transcriptional regulator